MWPLPPPGPPPGGPAGLPPPFPPPPAWWRGPGLVPQNGKGGKGSRPGKGGKGGKGGHGGKGGKGDKGIHGGKGRGRGGVVDGAMACPCAAIAENPWRALLPDEPVMFTFSQRTNQPPPEALPMPTQLLSSPPGCASTSPSDEPRPKLVLPAPSADAANKMSASAGLRPLDCEVDVQPAKRGRTESPQLAT